MAKAIRECRIWYSENGLFLDAKAKLAFDSAFKATREQSWRHAKDSYKLEDEQVLYQKVLDALDAITEAVDLPPLKGNISNYLMDDDKPRQGEAKS